MGKRAQRPARNGQSIKSPADPTGGQRTLVVCRGGDCGSRTKHPELDHRAQLRDLKAKTAGATNVIVTKCLDACDHSNVVVVLPDSAELGAPEPIWIGHVTDIETTNELIGWVVDADLQLAQQPVSVDMNQFSPTRVNRHELADEIADATPRKKR